jgi:glucose/mannose transport system substrate-binding protein
LSGLAALFANVATAGEIEVLHYWDVGSDARAAALLKSKLQAQGHVWKDFTVAGGGNGLATALLRARVVSGNAPSAAQIKTPVIQQWAREGVLANMDAVARAEDWDRLLPEAVSSAMKYKGSYVAVPVTVHRLNWLWVNHAVLKRARADIPKTWDEFFVAAEALRKAGYVPLAHGGQPWQDFMLFTTVALGVGGVDFYRKALVAFDPAELNGPVMDKVLRTFRRIKPYTDRSSTGRDWIWAAGTLVRGEAAMQVMGDWAKPVFAAAQRSGTLDFRCVPAPGTANTFSFTIDSFALFKVAGAAKVRAQRDFASALMSPAVQEEFNIGKGAIPVRLGMNLERFDECGRQAGSAFQTAGRSNTLVPDVAMSAPPAVEETLRVIVSDFWNDDRITPAATMARLAAVARQREPQGR